MIPAAALLLSTDFTGEYGDIPDGDFEELDAHEAFRWRLCGDCSGVSSCMIRLFVGVLGSGQTFRGRLPSTEVIVVLAV